MKKGTTFWRENKIRIDKGGEWMAVEIFQHSDNRTAAVRRIRKKKSVLSTPAQQNLNDKRSRRYFMQLVLANFREGDFVAHNTYSDKYLPETEEDARKILKKWLDRISYALKKQKKPPLKYAAITTTGDIHGRIHHHVFLSCDLSRDELEEMWWAVKGSKNRKREMLGGINVDRMKDWSGDGIFDMVKYVTRQAKGKKKWTQSQNLIRPKEKRPNDTKYSGRTMAQVMEMDMDGEEFLQFVQKNYPQYTVVQAEKAEPNLAYYWPGGIYLLLKRIAA